MNVNMHAPLHSFMSAFRLSDVQLREVYRLFCAEINKGLSRSTHAQADTKCFPTYVRALPTGHELGRYLALDLGGTNFRVLLVTLKGGEHEAQVESTTYAVSEALMLGPGVQLFDHIAECLATFVKAQGVEDQVLPLGFTFSFPCQQLGLTRALLVRWTKAFQCAGVVKRDVGQLLREAIQRRGELRIDVMAVLNDTTGTLMSCAHRSPACRIGVIIGTGCNACYVERVERIELLNDKSAPEASGLEHMLVNTEWGAFGEHGQLEFVRTEYDRQADRTTLNPGKQLFEKLISGMYLGRLVRFVLLDAIARDLIFTAQQSRQAVREVLLANVDAFQTKFISDVELDVAPHFEESRSLLTTVFGVRQPSDSDCARLQYICACISQRAATLVSVAIAGLINRIAESKVVVGVDGSVYRLHPKFDAYMRAALSKFVDKHIDFDLMLSEDGSGRGAALVAAVASAATNERVA